MAAFHNVKENRNLLFAEEDYVDGICDLDHGPMAMSTIQKWDKRAEHGSLNLGDDAFATSLPLLALPSQQQVELSTLHHKRPLVLTFGSFS